MEKWISCEKMTVWVQVSPTNTIEDCAPIIHKFKGQRLENLLYWLKHFKGLQVVNLQAHKENIG